MYSYWYIPVGTRVLMLASLLMLCNGLVPIGTTTLDCIQHTNSYSNQFDSTIPLHPHKRFVQSQLFAARRPASPSEPAPQNPSSSSSSSNTSSETQSSDKIDKTLYQLLNSIPSATRQDIKKEYVKLVKKTHPDATTEDTSREFQEIQTAWKTLSDPLLRKRYDRTLRAKEFTADVEDIMDQMGKQAAPKVAKAFDEIAIPFLRRSAVIAAGFEAVRSDIGKRRETSDSSPLSSKETTTSTSESVASNAGETLSSGTKNESTSTNEASSPLGIGNIWANAIEAGRKAGKAVDRLELEEKARELEKR